MDNKSIKSLYDEAVNIKNSLTPELNSVSQKSPWLFLFHWNLFYFQARTQELEQSIRNSTVRINFEKSKTDEFLTSLRAENDTIFIKMASNLEVTQHSHVKYLSVRYLSLEFSEWHSYDIFNYVYVGKYFFGENRLSQCKLQRTARKSIYRGKFDLT